MSLSMSNLPKSLLEGPVRRRAVGGQVSSHAQLPAHEILKEWYQVLEEEKISYVRPQHAAQREGAQEHAERGPAQMPDGGLGLSGRRNSAS